MTVLAIVQARMGSTRLPGKAMADLAGRPLLDHVLARVKAARLIDDVLLAVPSGNENLVLEQVAKERGVATFFGPESDVLRRFEWAARAVGHEGPVCRITADDPFKDPQLVDDVVEEFFAGPCDYCSNCHPATYPEGCDVEVMGRDALAHAQRDAVDPLDREHVTTHMWTRPREYRHRLVWREPSLAHWRWTVDTRADLSFAEAVYDRLYAHEPLFGFDAVRDLMDDPEIRALHDAAREAAR